MSSRRTRVTSALVVLPVLVLASCRGTSEPRATYTPVPDARLFGEVERLDGVVAADLAWKDTMALPRTYAGTVFVRGVSPCEVLDRVYATLWQGRPGAAVAVEVVRGSPPRAGQTAPAGLTMNQVDREVDLDPAQRYGEQPGTGRPPDDRLCR
jgi:hypothetical protein